jgi:antitoxin component HigA of HigAB toxin-antitoxin module
MSPTTTRMDFAQLPTDFNELVRNVYTLRPIHDDVEYGNVGEILDVLAVNEDRLNTDQRDFLEALTALIEQYDRAQEPLCASRITGLEALKFLLKENDMNGSDLGRLLGHRTAGSAILRGKRKLTIAQIRKLAGHFSVDASLFL